MAPPVVAPPPAEDLLEPFQQPPPDGMVLPPKHTQVQIEKLADFLTRRTELYARTLQEAKNGRKNFFCMLETDDYHPFFKWRMEECQAGRTALKGAASTQSAPAKQSEPEPPKGPEEPPAFFYTTRLPQNISALDHDTIHITAQYTAVHGTQWLRELTQREGNNPSFDFVRVQHSYHQFFQRLVDQYKYLADGSKREARQAQLKEDAENKYGMLDRATKRAEWEKYQSTKKDKQEEADEARRRERERIDWNDFKVIAKVEFTPGDDNAVLSAPLYLSAIQSMSLSQKSAASLVSVDRRLEETMIWDTSNMGAVSAPVAPPPVAMPTQPGFYPPPFPPPFGIGPMAPGMLPAGPQQPGYAYPPNNMPMGGGFPPPGMAFPPNGHGQYPQQPPPAPEYSAIPPAPGYQHRREARLVPCPNCGAMLPPNELDQHIKIELMDPNARQQKERADARYESINRNPDITRTIKKMVDSRPDMHDPALRVWANGSEPPNKRPKY